MIDHPPCTHCGQIHTATAGKGGPPCAAHRSDGQPCRNVAARGQDVCRFHGGSAPQAKAAAVRRQQARAALLAVETFGLPVQVDPHQALLDELHRTAGAVAWLGAIVADLDQGEVVWGLTREKVGGEDRGTTKEAGTNAWVQLWQQERRHLVDVAKACVSAGIEERRVRLAEDAGRVLAGVVSAVLGRLNLTSEQQALVPVVVPEELRRAATPELGGAA